MEPRCSGGIEMEACETKALISRDSVYEPQLRGGGGGKEKKHPIPGGGTETLVRT